VQPSKGPIGSLDQKKPIRIYGAGVSGLLFAYTLEKKGFNVEVHEKSSSLGGKINSKEIDYGLAETGANAIYTNQDVFELINELKLDYICASSKLKKKILRSPNCFKLIYWYEIIMIILRVFKSTPQVTKEITVRDFFLPLLGKKLCDDVLSSALSGVYATTSEHLNFISLFNIDISFHGSYLSFFKTLKKNKKGEAKAQSISFKGGMKTFIERLSQKIKGTIYFNSSPSLDTHFNNIICTNAQEAGELISENYPELSITLRNINYLPLSTSTYICKKEISELDSSFGLLLPRSSGHKTMGILNNTAIFNRSKDLNYFSYTFITPSTEDVRSIHLKEVNDIFEYDLEKSIMSEAHTLWPHGIPLYDLNRLNCINQLRSDIYNYSAGLVLQGNYVDGISIRELISKTKAFCEDLK